MGNEKAIPNSRVALKLIRAQRSTYHSPIRKWNVVLYVQDRIWSGVGRREVSAHVGDLEIIVDQGR